MQAIKILNMIKVHGKPIRVNKASQDKKQLDVGANLFIGNIDPDVDEKVGCSSADLPCQGAVSSALMSKAVAAHHCDCLKSPAAAAFLVWCSLSHAVMQFGGWQQ